MMSVDIGRSFPLRAAYIGLVPLQHPHDSQSCFNSPSEWGHFVTEQLLKPEDRAEFSQGCQKKKNNFWIFVGNVAVSQLLSGFLGDLSTGDSQSRAGPVTYQD